MNLTFPNLDNLNQFQKEVILESPQRFKVLRWHRRSRKTTTAVNETIKQALIRKGLYWHVFPTYGEAKDVIWRQPDMLFGIVPPELIKKKNEVDLTVELINGSIYQLKGADNPDSLRGRGVVGAILDEFSLMKFQTWEEIIQPMVRANNGWCWFVGTPKGKNHFYNLFNYAMSANDPEWKAWTLRASTSGIIPQHELINIKNTMSEALYNQEFESEFLEGEGSVFRGVREIATAKPMEPIKDHIYVIGVDLARVQDYTVIVVYDRMTNEQVYQQRFNKFDWSYQKEVIKTISKKYNDALCIVDAGGPGDPIIEDLIRSEIPVEPFKFTGQSKKPLIEKLSIFIEQKSIRILPIDITFLEFDNFYYEMGSNGFIRYNALPGFHDDIIIAHGLAVKDLYAIKIDAPEDTSKLTLLQKHLMSKIKPKDEYNEYTEYESE